MTITYSGGCGCELLPECHTCGYPPVARLVTGCEHEHLDEEDLCARHTDMVTRGHLLCSVCWDAGAHVRKVVLAKVMPSGEVVRVLTN